ncbi:DUF3006 family protein (plasmid) [Natrialba magadii ATCC 43099]|uniref:DUF3006 family protein n=1 Tax=Natrialba magadii (strain ATCC 43099 / DSM 3394 / CCM 3739 / CIP 104546 / IAM 13178 / JCM 8861 / NBRC 102185 / NCIMB 2190 / MS3) TaxID=547559 RepID=D3T292_NATMM|nr:DUF3006 domain-containing protein [Natrialba magadii]ADD07701.1 DUF3006 family protein [Natrialba magadii ATCC 43099]ELY26513.1 hypothetical protein C500_15160 [Natrialba magadii ATCC 43099]
MTKTYIATLDRIVDGQTAVLLFEEDDETVDQLDVDVTTLPPEAQHEGAVLEIAVEANELCEAEYLPEVTQSHNESVQERLDRLSTKLSEKD